MILVLIAVLVVLAVVVAASYLHNARNAATARAADLVMVKTAVDDDIRALAAELDDLKRTPTLDAATDDTRRAYEQARGDCNVADNAVTSASKPDDIAKATAALESGRYKAECVRARLSGLPVPAHRPPCFFNPQHGPAERDVDWAPPDAPPRPVPSCAADAESVLVGGHPDTRMVAIGSGKHRIEYWRAGVAFVAYGRGYFAAFPLAPLPGSLAALHDDSDRAG